MTIKLSTPQLEALRKIRGGLNSNPAVPSKIIQALTSKRLIEEYRDRFGSVRYRLTEEGWRFF